MEEIYLCTIGKQLVMTLVGRTIHLPRLIMQSFHKLNKLVRVEEIMQLNALLLFELGCYIRDVLRIKVNWVEPFCK